MLVADSSIEATGAKEMGVKESIVACPSELLVRECASTVYLVTTQKRHP